MSGIGHNRIVSSSLAVAIPADPSLCSQARNLQFAHPDPGAVPVG